jgi:putative membrane protein insertion efficiency factor
MQKLIIGLIHLYRLLLSPFIGQHCRFHPSCSEYAVLAVEQHGVFKGSWLALRRLSKCHPWHEGGLDPVPENKAKK